MKKYIAIILFALTVACTFTSCLDNTNDEEYEQYLKDLEAYNKKVITQYKADSLLITEYLAKNQLPATIDSLSGIYYHVIEPGNDNYHPTKYSYITVLYKGSLLDGTIFDQTKDDQSVQYYLGNLISGWQIGLQKIGAEGKIILYLPSFYGYGTNETGKIPANSVLIFEIELINYY